MLSITTHPPSSPLLGGGIMRGARRWLLWPRGDVGPSRAGLLDLVTAAQSTRRQTESEAGCCRQLWVREDLSWNS